MTLVESSRWRRRSWRPSTQRPIRAPERATVHAAANARMVTAMRRASPVGSSTIGTGYPTPADAKHASVNDERRVLAAGAEPAGLAERQAESAGAAAPAAEPTSGAHRQRASEG